VPEARPDIVVLVPVPVVWVPPGCIVSVHVPVEGRLLKTTLPVATSHVGCVIVPSTGAAGVSGGEFITMPAVGSEVHPSAFVTVNVYVPADSPVTTRLSPDPVIVTLPGFIVSVHCPVAGKPVSSMLPVGEEHEGCVTVPGTGADGFVHSVQVYRLMLSSCGRLVLYGPDLIRALNPFPGFSCVELDVAL
jgi:hypothetical protein